MSCRTGKLAIAVMAVLGMLLFITCSGPSQKGETDSGQRVVSQGKQDPFGKYSPEITLTTIRTMSSSAQFDQNDPDKKSYDENRWVRTFKEDLGINVVNLWIAPDTDSTLAKWNASIASGDVPDFAVVGDNVYKLLYDADLVADMGQILEDYATEDFLSTLMESDYQMMTQDGKLLGFPGGKKAMAGTTLMFIRKDWLDKVGLSLPETMDDVVSIAKAFKNGKLGGNETIGLLLSNNTTGGVSFLAGDGKWDGFFNSYGAYLNYWLIKDGKLAYSNVQPEVKNALRALQNLYRDSIINRDFAVVNDSVAREYVASGKVGIFYATAWNVTQGMNTLVKTDPNAQIVNIYPPPAVKGQEIPLQTNSPKGMRIFVSKKSKHPEAVVKLANMAYRYKFTNWKYYMEDEVAFPYFKYLPFNGDVFAPAEDDLLKSHAMRTAELSGSTEPLADASWQGAYTGYIRAKQGLADPWNMMLYGPTGSFSTLYDSYHKGLILLDAYNGLPTDTQILKGDIINGELTTAMFEVIMGADLSTYDRAVERWFANGGTQITEEVNKWYQSLKKN